MEITRNKQKFSVDVKYFYLPYTVTDNCPECGEACVRDLSKSSCISYPTLGDTINIFGFCYKCGNDWDINITLDVSVNAQRNHAFTLQLTEEQLLSLQLGQHRNGETLTETLIRLAGLQEEISKASS